MRHCKHKRITKKGLAKSLLRAIAIHGRIVTTQVRAKLLRSLAEKTMTKVKKCIESNNLVLRRDIISSIGKDSFASLEKFYPTFKDRNGGYTRIVKLMARKGDNADMAVISIIGANNE